MLKLQDVPFWNPRASLRNTQFLELDGGMLHPLTPSSAFTIRRLWLNHPPLLAFRVQRRAKAQTAQALVCYGELLELQAHLQTQAATLLQEQRAFLAEHTSFAQVAFG